MTRRPKALPPACGRCRDYGGLWAIGAGGGVRRCTCPRGARLAELDAKGKATGTHRSRARVLPAVQDWKAAAAGERI
jgi:hypothetical protein